MKGFGENFNSARKIVCGMRRRDESGFELRRCEINAAVQTGVEEFCESLQIASVRAGKIHNRSAGEERTKHRADAMKRDVDFRLRNRRADQSFEFCAKILQ